MKKTTKERILEVSLFLFSEHGYKGTSMKKIAEEVGIKDSSIYKHFKSKQEIFDQIVISMSERVQKMSEELEIPTEDNLEEVASQYGNFPKEKIVQMVHEVVLFYLADPFIAQFRKLAMREQYLNDEIYNAYRHYFIESSIEYLTMLFQNLIEQGTMKKQDPEILAIGFYSPIFFFLNKYADQPSVDSHAWKVLDHLIGEFFDKN